MLEIRLKNTYKKLIHYFSIFTIILGTTFGSFNAANAADFSVLDAAATDNAAATTVLQDSTAIDFDETGALTITSANGSETLTHIGAITRSAGNPTVIIQSLAGDTDDESIVVDSITFAVAGEGDIEFTSEDNAAADGAFTVTVGALSTLGKFEIDANDANGTASVLTVNLTGTTAVTEASTVVSAAKNSANLNILFIFESLLTIISY